jgi:hypothetical protein
MTYTINGKEYTEFDINKRCAELLAWESAPNVKSVEFERGCFWINSVGYTSFKIEDYCNNPADTWPIIDKCWDKLLSISVQSLSPNTLTKWGCIMDKHNCTKLIAACICLIESKEGV